MTTPEKKSSAPTKKTSTPVKKPVVKKTVVKKTVSKSPSTKVTAQRAVADTEKVVDNAVKNVTKKMEKHIDPTLRDKANQIASEAEYVANTVEKFGDSVGSVTDSIFPSWSWSYGSYNADYTQQVSRLFIFRCLRLIIQWPVTLVWSIWYVIISVVHYITMFLTWSRDKTMRNKQARYRRHVIAWKSYMNALTDKRPDIIVD